MDTLKIPPKPKPRYPLPLLLSKNVKINFPWNIAHHEPNTSKRRTNNYTKLLNFFFYICPPAARRKARQSSSPFPRFVHIWIRSFFRVWYFRHLFACCVRARKTNVPDSSADETDRSSRRKHAPTQHYLQLFFMRHPARQKSATESRKRTAKKGERNGDK